MNAATHLEHATTLPTSPAELIFNDHAFERMERVAQIMASGRSTIPQHLRGSVGDCFAILMQAARWKMDPYAVAQKTHFINSNIGYEAQLVAAVINNNAPITGRLNYEQFGPWEKVIGKSETRQNKEGKTYRVPGWKPDDEAGCGVRVWATIRGEDEPREIKLMLSQALTRNSTLWAEDPVQQLCYLAAKRWARRHCPDVIMGVYTPDELERPSERDMGAAEVIPKPEPAKASQSVKERIKATKGTSTASAEPTVDYDATWAALNERFDGIQTLDELKSIKAEAMSLPEPYRTKAGQKYKQCRSEILQAMKDAEPADAGGDQAIDQVDMTTGEILDDNGPIPGLDD